MKRALIVLLALICPVAAHTGGSDINGDWVCGAGPCLPFSSKAQDKPGKIHKIGDQTTIANACGRTASAYVSEHDIVVPSWRAGGAISSDLTRISLIQVRMAAMGAKPR